jgi:hypothetical protein
MAVSPAVSIDVTGLQADAPEPEIVPQPEIVVIENNTTIEQTPEGNMQWQERIEVQIRESHQQQLEQTMLVIQTIQSFRELLDKILNCLLMLETRQSTLPPQTQQEQVPEEEVEEVEIVAPEAAETTSENPDSLPKENARKRRPRI